MDGVTPRRRDLLLAAGVWLLLPAVAAAQPGARRLRLRHEHTGESFDGYYRDGEGPIPDVMAELAWFLRDHHVDRPGPVDLAMLDILADVVDAIAADRATVLSAYRTPETNRRLAATTFGVAEKSQHLDGRAIDVTFDRRLVDAERAAREMQRGGVGWYPQSHFIHLDSGPLRHWELRGGGFARLLAGHRPGHPLTVRERLSLHRALARQQRLRRR